MAGRGRGYTGRHHLREGEPVLEPARPPISQLDPTAKAFDAHRSEPANRHTDKHSEQFEDASLDEELVSLLLVDDKYASVVAMLDQFNLGEDGILFNQKLRHFESTLLALCPTDEQLSAAFRSLVAAALSGAAAARKLAKVGATFTRNQKQNALRTALLNVMQESFAKLEILERSPAQFLVNAANLMGDYFADARFCNGSKIYILSGPLLCYMRSLLLLDDLRAHRTLATQLLQNGRDLLTNNTQELEDLSIAIRVRLLNPPPCGTVWLLLAADLCLNKFLPLPSNLQQFYASHIDLSQEIDQGYSEVRYGSWKKEEQHRRKDDEDSSPEDFAKDLNKSSDFKGISTESLGHSVSQMNLSLDQNGEPRKLRPILGAGARSTEPEPYKSSLAKRYDLNSWRQDDEVRNFDESYQSDDNDYGFDARSAALKAKNAITRLSASKVDMQGLPDFSQPPPSFPTQKQLIAKTPESYPDRNQLIAKTPESYTDRNQMMAKSPESYPDRNQLIAKTPESYPDRNQNADFEKALNFPAADRLRKPPENWRNTEDGKPKNWARQVSNDDVDDDERSFVEEKFRSTSKPDRVKVKPKEEKKRNPIEVPRNHRYWDHDDRCDKNYSTT